MANVIIKYFLLMCVFVTLGAAFLVVDAYLKCKAAAEDPLQADKNFIYNQKEQHILVRFYGKKPDFRLPFSIKSSVRWTELIIMSVMQAGLLLWCFQF